MYKSQNPDLDELRALLKDAVQKQMEHRAVKKFEKQLEGVAATITQLQNPEKFKERITLNEAGHVINGSIKPKPVNSQSVVVTPQPVVIRTQATDEIAGAVAHPTKPSEIRKLIRSKMIRCKRCKNRFLEKNLYERHLRDKHQVDHLVYVIKQEEERQQRRKEELEARRIEEITTGGFIPPENEVDSSNYDVEIDEIPLPGELTGGVPARFNKYGVVYQPKRVYTKKISPQCPFCDKRYKDEPNLTKHIAKKHPECVEFVQCLKCFKALPSKEDLDSHMCEMVFMCFECTPIKNLCTDVRLYEHRRRFHRGDKSGFKCDLCNKKFLTPRDVKRHKKMTHVFEKTYSCHFCEELFTSPCDVVKHERIHTGIIEFKCKICDYKCNRFLPMEQHKRDEHGYVCSVCQEKFAEYGDLKSHTLNAHGGYLSSEFQTGYIESPRVWVMFKGE
ncbi:zinc finger protein ZFMSA12A [Ditylenchus destructor]|nr:zinc finger protein ZFMSA12A [Ditylenchus destructor]